MYGCHTCHRTVLPAPNAKQVCTDSGFKKLLMLKVVV